MSFPFLLEIPDHLLVSTVKRTNLTTFTRLHQTCRQGEEFLSVNCKDLIFPYGRRLSFKGIFKWSESDDPSNAEMSISNLIIRHPKKMFAFSMVSIRPRFSQRFVLSSLEDELRRVANCRFSKISTKLSTLSWKAFKANRIECEMLSAADALELDLALQILKPRRLKLTTGEEFNKESARRIDYSKLEKCNFSFGTNKPVGEFLMLEIVPRCKNVHMQTFSGTLVPLLVDLIRNVLTGSVANKRFKAGTIRNAFPTLWDLLQSYNEKSLKISGETPKLKTTAYLIPIPEGKFFFLTALDVGIVVIKYIVVDYWEEIERKLNNHNFKETLSEESRSNMKEFFLACLKNEA